MHPKPMRETRRVLCPRVICCIVSLLLSNGMLFFRTGRKRHRCMDTLCMLFLVIRNLGGDRCQMVVDLTLRILHASAMLLQQVQACGDGSLTLSHEVGVMYHLAHGHAQRRAGDPRRPRRCRRLDARADRRAAAGGVGRVGCCPKRFVSGSCVPSPACGGGTGRGHATRLMRARSPPPHPPAEVGFIRLRPLNGDRTRVNPSSVASGGGSTPSAGRGSAPS
jgi:hypothetical protein